MAKSLLTLLALGAGLVDNVVADPRVVKLPMYRTAPRHVAPIRKRAGTPPTVPVINEALNYLYAVNATVGSNSQPVQLQIDTGSSDVWMFGTSVCEESEDLCSAGYFNTSASSSYNQVGEEGLFEIQYVTPGSGVKGNYFRDTFALSGSPIKLTNMTMAVASSAKAVDMGIMGIGFTKDESIYANSEETITYPSIIDVMVSEGVIASHSYSLYLDDLEASTGSVVFGGYDPDKFTPPLTVLDVQPDAQTDSITSFTVAWSYIGVTTGSGSTTIIPSNDFPLPAVLDSGTSLTVIPQDLFLELASFFNATNLGDEYGWVVPCSNANNPGSIDFGFGSSDGPVIQVPFSEMFLPAVDENGKQLTYPGSKQAACAFGMSASSPEDPILLGDTFLRSAYVVYDLEAEQVAIAQAKYNSDSSNIQEIPSGKDLASILGSAASSVSAPTITQTATGIANPGKMTETAASVTSVASNGHINGQATTLKVSSLVTAAGSKNTAGSGSGAPSNRVFHASAMPVWLGSLIGLFVSSVAVVAFF